MDSAIAAMEMCFHADCDILSATDSSPDVSGTNLIILLI